MIPKSVLVHQVRGAPIELLSFLPDSNWYYPYAETETRSFIHAFGSVGLVALDVGANIGVMTVTMAQAGMEVHAFEPSEDNVRWLHRNVSVNCRADTGARIYLRHLFVGSVDKSLQQVFWSVWGRSKEVNTAPVVTIDGYVKQMRLDRVDLIKIDTDGWEEAILVGAERTLRTSRPFAIVEEDSSVFEIDGQNFRSIARLMRSIDYVKLATFDESNGVWCHRSQRRFGRKVLKRSRSLLRKGQLSLLQFDGGSAEPRFFGWSKWSPPVVTVTPAERFAYSDPRLRVHGIATRVMVSALLAPVNLLLVNSRGEAVISLDVPRGLFHRRILLHGIDVHDCSEDLELIVRTGNRGRRALVVVSVSSANGVT